MQSEYSHWHSNSLLLRLAVRSPKGFAGLGLGNPICFVGLNQLRVEGVVPLPDLLDILKGPVLWGTTQGKVLNSGPTDLFFETDGVLWYVPCLEFVALGTALVDVIGVPAKLWCMAYRIKM